MKKSNFLFVRPRIIFPAILLCATVILFSCEPEMVEEPILEMNAKVNSPTSSNLSAAVFPHKKIADLRAAVAHLRDFETAVAAGYSIELTPYVSQMGFHYLNEALLDDTFEVEKPEVLMFAPAPNGEMRFVGVEYATEIDFLDNPPPAPEGFSGTSDRWEINSIFSVWTLHVWVGLNNPDGIFTSHNPRLPDCDIRDPECDDSKK